MVDKKASFWKLSKSNKYPILSLWGRTKILGHIGGKPWQKWDKSSGEGGPNGNEWGLSDDKKGKEGLLGVTSGTMYGSRIYRRVNKEVDKWSTSLRWVEGESTRFRISRKFRVEFRKEETLPTELLRSDIRKEEINSSREGLTYDIKNYKEKRSLTWQTKVPPS